MQSARPSADSGRPDPPTVSLSTSDQVGEFLIHAEIVHEARWREAVAKLGKSNLHLLLAELAAPPDAENDFSSTYLLRERRLTRYQVDQILSGKLSGLTLGPYIFRKRLGRGGMAEVMQAYNRELDRIEAVKVLRGDKPRSGVDMAALVRREARVLASLVHPNITTVFRADTTGGTTYLAMEYVPGETVEAKIARLTKTGEYLPVREAVRITLEASFALAYAHSKHVVHRDVKPGNIMVTPDDRVKVLDVGIAALFAPEKEESFGKGAPKEFSSLAGFGTPHYMAPEQWKDNQTTESVDVYGLAATLFHMLVGRPPFAEKDLEVLLARKKEGAVNPASLRREIPHALGLAVQKGLAGDSAKRYSSMEAFAAALEPFCQDAAAVPRPIPWLGVVGVLALAGITLRMEQPAPAILPVPIPLITAAVSSSPQAPSEGRNPGRGVRKADTEKAAIPTAPSNAAPANGPPKIAPTPAVLLAQRRTDEEKQDAAWAAKLTEDPNKVLQAAAEALRVAPDSARLFEWKARALVRLGRFADAVREYEAAVEKAPTDAKRVKADLAETLRQQALHGAGLKRFREAEQTLSSAIKRYPDQAALLEETRREVLVGWASWLVESGAAPAAYSIIAQARAAAPKRPEPIRLQAVLSEKTKNWQAAAAAWLDWGAAAHDERTGNANAASCWRRWGKEAAENGDHRAAVDRFENVRRLAPDKSADDLLAASRNHLGFALHRQGDEKGAVAEYTKALDTAPNSAVTYRNRGFSHLQLKDYIAAERDYTQAIKLDGVNAIAYRMRGLLRLLNLPDKNWTTILDDFREAARLDPGDHRTHYYLAYVYVNCPERSHRDAAKALQHAEKACKATNFSNWEYLAMLAAAHAAAGDHDAALKRIEQAERLAPNAHKPDLKALAESFREKE